MAAPPRPRLVVPALFAFCVLGAASGCGDDSSTSPLDDVECYDRANEADCLAASARACDWAGDSCYPDCNEHPNEAACNDDPTCQWVTDTCVLPI